MLKQKTRTIQTIGQTGGGGEKANLKRRSQAEWSDKSTERFLLKANNDGAEQSSGDRQWGVGELVVVVVALVGVVMVILVVAGSYW